jgi:uncharacterized protein
VTAADAIVGIILEYYGTAQAVYLFGTYGNADQWPGSDVDIAVLLPPEEARARPTLVLTPCHFALEEALGRSLHLLHARMVSTVFQKQIIGTGRQLHVSDEMATAEFEMLTLSYYQKPNEERAAIPAASEETGRAYDV